VEPTVYSGDCMTCDYTVTVADTATTDVMRVPKAEGKLLETFTICDCGQIIPLTASGCGGSPPRKRSGEHY
jgi:hypothetical protein